MPLRRVVGRVAFREVGVTAGLKYRWSIPGKRPLNILQTIGNGCAFLDFDNDGNLDILLVGPRLALFKGDGKGHFTDVSAQAGLSAMKGHFLGCAVGDFDNDGFEDLYISAYRGGVLLHNEGGRGFRDVTRQAGIAALPWGTSCAFADVDGDGFLDLYIANYVAFDPNSDLLLCRFHGVMTGCGPRDYEAEHGVLYHNESGRGFRDMTRSAGVAGKGKGLGVAFATWGSGEFGFAVANDLMPGDLFRRRNDGRFIDIGPESGTSVDPVGEVHAGMGIDWGDYDNDGRPDLFVTTFRDEAKCLYRNEGNSLFTCVTDESGVDAPTLPYVGWGCKFFDADNDGWLDLIVANGHVQDNVSRFEQTTFRQPVVFLDNAGGKPARFHDFTQRAGLKPLGSILGRGLAVGDYDNDGLVDVLVVDSEGRPLLLHNESVASDAGWIGLRLIGTGRSNRDGYGAVVHATVAGRDRVRECHADGSYLSSSDSRVVIGLAGRALEKIAIHWPDGAVDSWSGIQPRRYYAVREGKAPELSETQAVANR